MQSGGVACSGSVTAILQQMGWRNAARLYALLWRLERAQLPDVADARADDGALEHDQHAQREQRVVPAKAQRAGLHALVNALPC